MTTLPDLLQIIRQRRSIRTFEPVSIPDAQWAPFAAYVDALSPLYGDRFRLRLIRTHGPQNEKPVRLGTYGVIYGASAYLAAVMTKKGNAFDLGYVIELAILKATSLGLGTV